MLDRTELHNAISKYGTDYISVIEADKRLHDKINKEQKRLFEEYKRKCS